MCSQVSETLGASSAERVETASGFTSERALITRHFGTILGIEDDLLIFMEVSVQSRFFACVVFLVGLMDRREWTMRIFETQSPVPNIPEWWFLPPPLEPRLLKIPNALGCSANSGLSDHNFLRK